MRGYFNFLKALGSFSSFFSGYLLFLNWSFDERMFSNQLRGRQAKLSSRCLARWVGFGVEGPLHPESQAGSS